MITIADISAAVEALASADPALRRYIDGEAPRPSNNSDPNVTIYVGEAAEEMLNWAPPVIVAPQSFLDEVRKTYGVERTDYEVDELCGLRIMQREGATEPVILLSDGRTVQIGGPRIAAPSHRRIILPD